MSALVNLANAVGELGDNEMEKELNERVLAIQEKHYCADHPKVGMTLGNLALAVGALGDIKTMKELLERALAIKEKHYGPHSPEVATALEHLASPVEDLGDLKTAKELYERALAIQGENENCCRGGQWRANILHNIGSIYFKLGDYKAMVLTCRKAVGIMERLAPDHPDTTAFRESLARAERNYYIQNGDELSHPADDAFMIFVNQRRRANPVQNN